MANNKIHDCPLVSVLKLKGWNREPCAIKDAEWILSEHALERFPVALREAKLKSYYDRLVPGGRLDVIVWNPRRMLHETLRGNIGLERLFYQMILGHEDWADLPKARSMPEAPHKSIVDQEDLFGMLLGIGFKGIVAIDPMTHTHIADRIPVQGGYTCYRPPSA